jgi:hypothetical protein
MIKILSVQHPAGPLSARDCRYKAPAIWGAE